MFHRFQVWEHDEVNVMFFVPAGNKRANCYEGPRCTNPYYQTRCLVNAIIHVAHEYVPITLFMVYQNVLL